MFPQNVVPWESKQLDIALFLAETWAILPLGVCVWIVNGDVDPLVHGVRHGERRGGLFCRAMKT